MDVGLPIGLVNVIMECMSTSTLQVLWNGAVSQIFYLTRGVR